MPKIRNGGLVLGLIAPIAGHGQDTDNAALTETPRAWQTFDQVRGYEDMPEERFGTTTDPVPSEMGMLLVQRMFRNVCLGLERGDPLDVIIPPGFSEHASGAYLFGNAGIRDGDTRVLSATGSLALDEDEGHPAIWVRPVPGGATCAIEWTVAAEIEPARQRGMAVILREWLPYEMALVRAARPSLAPEPPPSDVLEWDRPCFDRWCPLTASYIMSVGHIRIETRLNIPETGDTRP